MQDRSLAVVPDAMPRALPAVTYTMPEMERLAIAMANSGFFEDSKQAAQALVKIVAGREYGLGPTAAMTGIYIVKGRLSLAATTIAGMIKRTGRYDYRPQYLKRAGEKLVPVTDRLNDVVAGCVVRFFDRGVECDEPGTFTDTDAARAGLSSGENWKKYPRAMYFSRALTAGARLSCPELFGGACYTPDELSEAITVDSAGLPVNYAPPRAPDAPLPLATTSDRKGLSNTKLQERFATIAAHCDGMTLGAWLEKTVAPGLSRRLDPITSRNPGLTTQERIAAEDALTVLMIAHAPERCAEFGIVAPSPASSEPAPAPAVVETVQHVPSSPAVAAVVPMQQTFDIDDEDGDEDTQAQADFLAQMGSGPVFAPPRSDAHKAIMAAFNDRKQSLTQLMAHITRPHGMKAADHWKAVRYAFAGEVLRDPRKGSSTTWAEAEYRAVFDALKRVTLDNEPTL